MADDIDKASDFISQTTDSEISAIRKKAGEMPKGTPGDCSLCGEWSQRLVNDVCAPCRDAHNLP